MRFERSVARLALSLILLLPAANLAAAGIEFNRSEEGTLHFDVPAEQSGAVSSLKAELYDARLIGKLEPGGSAIPYFVFSAKPCTDCPQDRGIYVLRPTIGFKPFAVTHPGKLIDPKQGAVMDARAFLGKCLKSRTGEVLVVFQKEKIDRKKRPQASVFIAEPGIDHLKETLLESRLPNFNDTLRFVKKKLCREIEGRNRAIQNKSFEIKTRFKRDEEADDEDEEASKSDQSSPEKL